MSVIRGILVVLLSSLLFGPVFAELRVLITYDSADGHTEQVAEWIAEGVREYPNAELRYKLVGQTTHEDLVWADAVIVGSPVYNTGPTPDVGAFLAGWPFDEGPLKNRVGAAFVSCKGATAGAENTLFQILKTMLMFRMITVGGEEWRTGFGVAYVRDGITDQTLGFLKKQSIDLGRRVCRVAEATESLRP